MGNPNGSGMSLGHPVGTTGAIIRIKAIDELRISGRYALADHVHQRWAGHRSVF